MPTDGQEVRRGEIYMADLDPVVGHEQGGRRPFLVVSIDPMNRAPVGTAIGVPLTTTNRGSDLHVRLDPPEGGLTKVSFALPEMVRSISSERLRRRLGSIPRDSLEAVAKHAGILIGLGRTR
jgi:mRNA interferase MazF